MHRNYLPKPRLIAHSSEKYLANQPLVRYNSNINVVLGEVQNLFGIMQVSDSVLRLMRKQKYS
jgi:hypothetical protein